MSRQIRLLEDHLGKKLFVRSHRAVQLTAEGRSYLHTVATALAHVGAATRDLRSATNAAQLCVAVDQSVGHLWLLPRLGSFTHANPALSLNLIVSDEERVCMAPSVDVAIMHGEGTWPGHDSALLFAEEVFPVCSPDYDKETAGGLAAVERLAGEVLLDLDDNHWNWMNWRQWLNANGIGETSGPRRLQIGSYPLVVDAARRGLGIALGWRGLVDDDLASGHLVAPLRASVKTRFGYHVLWPRDREPSPAVRAFVHWAAGRI